MVLKNLYLKKCSHTEFSITNKKGKISFLTKTAFFPGIKDGGWANVWLDEAEIIFDSKDNHIIS